ncbi:lactate 2-monooxygenase [Streptomyces sp. NPDC015171]|uniref:lactate 2-monooxygenase n=1 Tax=Streptomyces sp. NPDC015171 TaxID=3364945 RepID=UPI0036FFF827
MDLADFQNEIYLSGLGGAVPDLPTDLHRLEELAAARLTPQAHGYVAGAAGAERTADANLAAFDQWRIVPRMLRDVAERDFSTTVLGTEMPAPVIIGPVGVLRILHPDGELAVARAAKALGVTVTLSTAASTTLEEVAAEAGPRWYQLYWPKDRELAASLVHRAAEAGYTALVVTLDTFAMAWRPRDLDRAYLPFLRGIGVQNYWSDPVFQKAVGGPVTDANRDLALLHWVANFGNPSLTWDDLAWLRRQWDGPIVLKGIQHVDDARRAVDAGMDGIVVSNHGGRQVDGAIASLDALPAIASEVGALTTVLFDSGIRSGADVAKALALGAKAVLIGRPYAYGLGLAGEDGVRHVLRSLMAELDLTLALAGRSTLADVGPDLLSRRP